MRETLAQYRDAGHLKCSLNTFGFGYNIESKLLSELATDGGGAYGFIPDCSFVGTVFINALANQLSTLAGAMTVTLEPLNGAVRPLQDCYYDYT